MLGLRKNHSVEQVIFNELVEPVHQLKLNHLKQFGARAAQIYKLLNQNSLSDALQFLRLEMSQNTVVWSYDADFCMTHSAVQFLQQSVNWGNRKNQSITFTHLPEALYYR